MRTAPLPSSSPAALPVPMGRWSAPLDRTERVARLDAVGTAVLRYGLVFLLLLWGAAKFTLGEAQGIQPLVAHSPLVAWLYPLLGLRGTSALFGLFEIPVALGIAVRHWAPRLSGYASLAAAGMFVVTLSFLFTTPGALSPASPFNGFLLKDVCSLGAGLVTAAEALRAARRRGPRDA